MDLASAHPAAAAPGRAPPPPRMGMDLARPRGRSGPGGASASLLRKRCRAYTMMRRVQACRRRPQFEVMARLPSAGAGRLFCFRGYA